MAELQGLFKTEDVSVEFADHEHLKRGLRSRTFLHTLFLSPRQSVSKQQSAVESVRLPADWSGFSLTLLVWNFSLLPLTSFFSDLCKRCRDLFPLGVSLANIDVVSQDCPRLYWMLTFLCPP